MAKTKNIKTTYAGSSEKLDDNPDKFEVKHYIMDSDPNLNGWQVTSEGKRNLLNSLKETPLLGPPRPNDNDLVEVDKSLPHGGKWSKYGSYKRFISNGALFGVAEIDSPYAREKILSGEWNHVSPSIDATVYETQDGKIVVQDGKFDHVLYVDNPAFTKADTREINNIGAALQAAFHDHNKVIVGTHLKGKATDLKQTNKNQGEIKMTIKKQGQDTNMIEEETTNKDKPATVEEAIAQVVQIAEEIKVSEEKITEAEKVLDDKVTKIAEAQEKSEAIEAVEDLKTENKVLRASIEDLNQAVEVIKGDEIETVEAMYKQAGLDFTAAKKSQLNNMPVLQLREIRTLVQAMTTKKSEGKLKGESEVSFTKFQSKKENELTVGCPDKNGKWGSK